MKKVEYNCRILVGKDKGRKVLENATTVMVEDRVGHWEHKGKFYLYAGTLKGIDYFYQVDRPRDDFHEEA